MPRHTYSIVDTQNSNERTHVLYKLAIGAGILTGAVGGGLSWLANHWGFAALTAPTTVAVYLASVRLVDRRLWKWKPARLALGISLPDLNGRWAGTVETRTRDGVNVAGNSGIMDIQQTWSTICVEFKTDRTQSVSSGAFIVLHGKTLELTIEYQASVRYPSREEYATLQAHAGTAKYFINVEDGVADKSKFTAHYYTNHRETGAIELEHLPKAPSL